MASTKEGIYRAVAEGNEGVVARMLDEEPGLLSSEWGGQTLLTWAAWRGRVGVVRLLMERGTDVNTSNAPGDTALHLAALNGREEVVSMLLSSGADISRRNNRGWTTLMGASVSGHVAVARLVLRSMGGRGVNERSPDGFTALRIACSNGYVDVLRALLQAGADHTIASNHGWTPQQIAQQKGHQHCVALIQWWEEELQRAYALDKAKTLHEDTASRQQAPAAPVPAYLSLRVQGGKPLPTVQVGGRGGSEGSRTRGAAKGGREEVGQEKEEKEEKLYAVVEYVVKDLAADLFTELMQGLRLR